MELLRAATTVLEIGNDGAVLMKRNPGDSINITAIAEELRQSSSELERSEESPPEKTELPSVDTSKPSPKSAKAPSADRRVGDWKLYVYFFRSSSVVILFLWLFFTAISAAMERIPRKSTSDLPFKQREQQSLTMNHRNIHANLAKHRAKQRQLVCRLCIAKLWRNNSHSWHRGSVLVVHCAEKLN